MSNHQYSDKIITDSIDILTMLMNKTQYTSLSVTEKDIFQLNIDHLVYSLNNTTRDHLSSKQMIEIESIIQKARAYAKQ